MLRPSALVTANAAAPAAPNCFKNDRLVFSLHSIAISSFVCQYLPARRRTDFSLAFTETTQNRRRATIADRTVQAARRHETKAEALSPGPRRDGSTCLRDAATSLRLNNKAWEPFPLHSARYLRCGQGATL